MKEKLITVLEFDQFTLAHAARRPKAMNMAIDPDIQAVLDEATADEQVESAAAGAITSLAQQLATAINNAQSLTPADRATLQAKVTEMKSAAGALGAAIAAGTAAAPPADSQTSVG